MIVAALMTFVSLLALMLFPGVMWLLPFRLITDEMTVAQQDAMDGVACA